MKIFKAPDDFKDHGSSISVFLAGSIDMNKAPKWQKTIEEELSIYPNGLLTVLNPRRDKYKTKGKQSISDPYFKKQVMWELAGIEEASIIFMYFSPDTLAPVTLLELGLYADRMNIVLVCPDGYWRKGNVEIVADVYKIPLYNSLEEGIKELHKSINDEK